MDNIKKLEEKVLERRPILGQILKEFGEMKLSDYVKRYYRKPDYEIDPDRKIEFINTFKDEVEEIFGKEIAESCAKQIDISYHLANVEHHGAIGTSRPLNNALIAASPFLNHANEEFPNNIILSCSNISFNNWTFPRGFKFHTYSNKGLIEKELSFFGHSIDSLPLINYKGFNLDSLKNMRKNLYTLWNERFIWKTEHRKLLGLIDEVFADNTVISQKIYTSQAAKFNFLLWQKISEVLGNKLQNLVFVEQEKLVNRLLLEHHIDKPTVINKILLDPKYLDLVSKHFDGVLTAFNESKQEGTFHFWGLPQGGKYRTQLWRKNDSLVSPDGNFEVKINNESLRLAIEKGELIPSSLLCFLVLSFYYGLRQIGGPNQTTALTQMKEAYVSLLKEAEDSENLDMVSNIPTTDIIPEMPPALAFHKGKKGELIAATPLDLYLYATDSTLNVIAEAANTITLGDAIRRTLPLWYKRCYTESEQEAELVSITEEQIDLKIGLNLKIKPFASKGDHA